MSEDTQLEKKIEVLKSHLEKENPILREVVDSFRELDKVAYRLGLLEEEQSYTFSHVSWWPMIAILGMFSSGKSTFINHLIGNELQRTGTQAVDDKFTVICFSGEEIINTLPGVALDADPRFPFYQISRAVREIVQDRGIDAYLQLKACPSEQLRGKILIDSPGFDADRQRTETLRVTEHIINLSDLVLVFFDARHPEPGAMRDTLLHLVTNTINRPDSNKFLYILNQIDVTAREDNPEDVIGAWHRSLSQAGLTAGRFYRIYNPEVAVHIADPKVKERFEHKRDADMKEINTRINQVEVERAYRIVNVLEQMTKILEHDLVPRLREKIDVWKTRTFRWDMIFWIGVLILAGVGYGLTGIGAGLITADSTLLGIELGVLLVAVIIVHFKIAGKVAKNILKGLAVENLPDEHTREGLMRAWQEKNTCPFRTLFMPFISEPTGWRKKKMHAIFLKVLSDANSYVQKLNDRFANPSGKKTKKESIPIEK